MDNTTVYGTRISHSNRCKCFTDSGKEMGTIDRLYEKLKPGFPYLNSKDDVPTFCGTDHQQYDKSQLKEGERGVKIINCGACGDCSTVQDVSVYRVYSQSMTLKLSQCAIVYTFLGESLARLCIQFTFSGSPLFFTSISTPSSNGRDGLTEKCTNRFIDNFGCTLTHCHEECLFRWGNPLSKISNNKDGNNEELNDCLLCDEVYCSPVFVKSAGANRRTSGTITDISRPGDDVCKYVNAV
jgi:hypothetical protein